MMEAPIPDWEKQELRIHSGPNEYKFMMAVMEGRPVTFEVSLYWNDQVALKQAGKLVTTSPKQPDGYFDIVFTSEQSDGSFLIGTRTGRYKPGGNNPNMLGMFAGTRDE